MAALCCLLCCCRLCMTLLFVLFRQCHTKATTLTVFRKSCGKPAESQGWLLFPPPSGRFTCLQPCFSFYGELADFNLSEHSTAHRQVNHTAAPHIALPTVRVVLPRYITS